MHNTRDLWFSAFLLLYDYKVIDFKKVDNNKYEFIFDIEDEKWKELKMLFNESDVSKVKYFQEKLKDLVN